MPETTKLTERELFEYLYAVEFKDLQTLKRKKNGAYVEPLVNALFVGFRMGRRIGETVSFSQVVQ